jgi:heme-NO-binding protein
VHGVIFTSFRDYLVAAHGNATAAAVFEAEPEYLLSDSYPDESLLRLVGIAAAHTGVEVDEIVFEFGVFTAEVTFARLYPAFFDVAPSARQFLLTVETRIHELVRATIPSAGPPQLDVAPLGDDRISIAYASPRRLCVLLRGLTEGAARHYGEHAEMEERTCMLRGDPACTFEVGFSAGSPSA